MAQPDICTAQPDIWWKILKIVSVHVCYFSLGQLGYVRLHQVMSVYVGGTGRGARQFINIERK